MMSSRPAIAPGRPAPLGATVQPDGVNFSLFSKNGSLIELLLFDGPEDDRPSRVVPLEPGAHRTFYYWHAFVPAIGPGQIYAYRARGPFQPRKGHRFDPAKVLLDPYGKAIAVPRAFSRAAACRPGDNAATAMKSVVAARGGYDWEGDRPISRPYGETVIYEMHVGGFTRDPSSGLPPEIRGTYRGLIEKIPYLQALGVTAVELLPVFQFDEQEAPPGLTNYWGYSPVSFFAPHVGYSAAGHPLDVLDEFRDMVKALHRAGIEVILDVVYNHTAEAGADGPTYSFKGLDNSVYYILEADKAAYVNFSGTGNTVNANNAVVRRLIVDSLRYWVEEMHVDGFRFDLASILSRDQAGRPMADPPVLWDIETDPRLAGAKLIAEAWDAGGLYQVGSFIGDRWTEWNGKFRDDVRAFLRGDEGSAAQIPARLLASPDLYGHEQREPEQSINYVTSHDGFTLNDLVSYNQKHNQANRELNGDGWDHNLSWNCGVEGPTDDPGIEALRNRQVKNFLAVTLLSLGTPMILMGDEVRRSQQGNNNPYCQDNSISWFDWDDLGRHADVLRFTQRLINFRLSFDIFRAEPGQTLNQFLEDATVEWHGTKLYEPDWGERSHTLAASLRSPAGRCILHLLLNAYVEPLEFELPQPRNGSYGWRRLIDTTLPSPEDISEPGQAPRVTGSHYIAGPRSVVVLMAEAAAGERGGVNDG